MRSYCAFSNRQQLAGLRLSLAIKGSSMIDVKFTEMNWYTHAESFAAAVPQQA
jgi:hypothetical protein